MEMEGTPFPHSQNTTKLCVCFFLGGASILIHTQPDDSSPLSSFFLSASMPRLCCPELLAPDAQAAAGQSGREPRRPTAWGLERAEARAIYRKTPPPVGFPAPGKNMRNICPTVMKLIPTRENNNNKYS